MALPPIISNLPIIRLFRPDTSGRTGKKDASAPHSGAGDTVEISSAALEKLNSAKDLDAGQARTTAVETGEHLANTDINLGLDPEFA